MLETRRIADDLGSTVLAFWPNRYRLLAPRADFDDYLRGGAATNCAYLTGRLGIYLTEIPLQRCV
jgi:hypothetical protein